MANFIGNEMLEGFLKRTPLLNLALTSNIHIDSESQAVVFAPNVLPDVLEYRATLRRWFDYLKVGGVIVLTVPHAFLEARSDRLPSPQGHRRLYTPASLLAEVEEALIPNSYRVRWLGDRDEGYDYAVDRQVPPVGQHDIVLALERISPPDWDLSPPAALRAASPPDHQFEPLRTRIETMASVPSQRILLLKLDHLGDFITGIPAIKAVRAHFPAAHITLVVGSWNEDLARQLDIADELLVFDAFPRNTAEAPVDIAGKGSQFIELVRGGYDLAIDLRSFTDTRVLLRDIDAKKKAGIGNRGAFPFLDIFLPIDPAAEHIDHAWAGDIGSHEFACQGFCTQTRFQIIRLGEAGRGNPDALTWGPYRNLLPGNYLFQPFLDVDFGQPGSLAYDVAIDAHRVVYGVFDGTTDVNVPFTVPVGAGLFEFRLWAVGEEAMPDFRFFGGRLYKQGAGGTLHQYEYQSLLVALIAMRLSEATLFSARRDA